MNRQASCVPTLSSAVQQSSPHVMELQEQAASMKSCRAATAADGKDLRPLTGTQDFVKTAPVNLVFVADFAKMGAKTSDADKVLYSATDTGFISQNVYLFCVSEGLVTVVRGLIDRPALANAMGLRDGRRIILAETVGFGPDK